MIRAPSLRLVVLALSSTTKLAPLAKATYQKLIRQTRRVTLKLDQVDGHSRHLRNHDASERISEREFAVVDLECDGAVGGAEVLDGDDVLRTEIHEKIEMEI